MLNSSYTIAWGGGYFPTILYRYVLPKGITILELLILYGVSILEMFPRVRHNILNIQKLIKLSAICIKEPLPGN